MFTTTSLGLLLTIVAIHGAQANFNGFQHSNTGEPDGVIVHLMDWRYEDIAYECETVLSKRGFAAVQVSPVTEYLIPPEDTYTFYSKFFGNRPWYDRHQVASHIINTPSGDEKEFKNMVERCNKAGIKVYVDVVLNHMTATYSEIKTAYAGSQVDTVNFEYPAVPYTRADFHESCLTSELDVEMLRNCEYRGLHDLNQTNPCVREKQRDFLNKLISFGVAGFRVGHARFMWPEELKKLFGRLSYLNCDLGFACETRPFIYLDTGASYSMIPQEYHPIKSRDYLDVGNVVEYTYAAQISKIFRLTEKATNFADINKAWKLMDSDKSIVFVDTYETANDRNTMNMISSKDIHLYKAVVALMLATPYGQPLITSTYLKTKFGKPPYGVNKEGKPAAANQQAVCANGWVCEHRYPLVYQMLKFRTIVEGQPVTNWWSNEMFQFAFSRGNKGFVLINNGFVDIKDQQFQTGLPKGTYCDIVSGETNARSRCTGVEVKVGANGKATISLLPTYRYQGILVIHVGAKIN